MHLQAAELEDALSQMGCGLRSTVLYEMARDEHGNLSRFKTGNRFVYMIVFWHCPQSRGPCLHPGPARALRPGALCWPACDPCQPPAPIPEKSPVACLPGSPTSSRPASPGPDGSSKPAASSSNNGKRPFSPQTPREKAWMVWPCGIKSRTQGRGFPLLRPGSDTLMTRNCPRTRFFRSHDFKWRLKLKLSISEDAATRLSRGLYFKSLKRKKWDIICLQESHITLKCADTWKRQWPGDFYFSERSSHGGGQIIMINKKLGQNNVNSYVMLR